MKNKFILLLFIGCFHFAFTQNDSLQISKDAQNSLKTALLQLESQSGYQIFFDEMWLNNLTTSAAISKNDLNATLDVLLRDTALNYYIIHEEKRIILIQNSVIYESLPRGFFGQIDSIANTKIVQYNQDVPPPVLYDNKLENNRKKFPLIRLGKTDKTSLKNVYKLSGRALNMRTKEAIPDLAIRVIGLNNVVVTDADGTFEIELPSGYNRISVSAMGIAASEREVLIFSDSSYEFEFEESLEQLEEVVVQADAVRNVEETFTGTEQIDLEESKNIPLVLGERDLLQVAKALPGISSAGEGATGLNVRGGKTDQNLVLLDDAVIYNPTHFFGIFQALNPFTTKGVEIYKGAAPVEFGGRLSSVFDIKSKEIMIGGRGAYADWILRSLDEESLSNSSASFFDGIVKYNHRINEKNDLKATAYYSRDAFSITSDSLYKYSNRLASLRWDKKFSERTTGALILQNSDYRFGIDFDASGNSNFDLNYNISETGLTYKLRTLSGQKHIFDYGLTAKFYDVNPGSIEPLGSDSSIAPKFIERERAVEGALFIGDELSFSDKFTVGLGLRYAFFAALGANSQRTYAEGFPINDATVLSTVDYSNGEIIKTYGGPEVRLSGRYLLDDNLSIKASFNNSYQFIHTLSNNTTVSPIDTWKLSDLNIKPQNGYQASLGLYNNFNDNMYELSIEGYYKILDNVTDFKTGADLFLNDNVETTQDLFISLIVRLAKSESIMGNFSRLISISRMI